MSSNHIYFDHGASTPLHPRVAEAMAPYWSDIYGNPSSYHEYGRQARHAVEQARQSIARSINAAPGEIVFTSGGSESDNLALRGTMAAARGRGRGNHLITSAIEHSAVGLTAAQLQQFFDCEVTIVGVDAYGRVRPEAVARAIRPDTALISIMAANNEIGTLQPLAEIGELARAHDIPFHSDAVQAIAVERWDMARLPVDMLSIAPHKFYGPKGVGILYLRQGTPLWPAQTGGDHEEGRRAGTVNVPLAVGAAAALELAMAELDELVPRYRRLRDHLIQELLHAFPGECILTGHPELRLPHNASFAFRNISGNELLMHLDMAGVAASSGSACRSGDPKPSAVLQALGLAEEWTKGGLRLTVGRQNTMAEVDSFLDAMPAIVANLRQPLLVRA